MTTIADLLDITAVAALADVAPATIRAYRARGYLPDPVAVYGGSPVWTREQIERWIATRPGPGRKPGTRADPSSASMA